ncbi:MAG: EAL domain-containing protein [Actinomycetota bacterium]|nr:EAL domain-containing protein [Actinomycetota bacterium]
MIPSDVMGAAEGVRLLSRRPSVLYKVEHLATEPASGDIAADGLVLSGPGWLGRLRDVLDELSLAERDGLFALRLGESHPLPLLALTLLDRERTDWFPEFLSKGRMVPHFQPIVDLSDGRVVGREALMRGRLGATEVRGGELVAAAEAHDALYSFDMRARAAALEVGLPLLPAGETLFINLDPRAVLDVEASVRQTWPVVERLGVAPNRICLELVSPERVPDRMLLERIVAVHREHGALIALDDLSGGADALACLEIVRPDVAKLDRAITAGIEDSLARRRLVAALVEYAQEQGCKVVAEGVETVTEFEVMRDLGVDYGQGYYFGHPTERPMEVDARLFRPRAQLV